jgi:hypothetical protein
MQHLNLKKYVTNEHCGRGSYLKKFVIIQSIEKFY